MSADPSEGRERARRNLNPHKPARVAMILWNELYAAQRGGSMDFWDSLTEGEKDICRSEVELIEKAPEEKWRG